MRVLARVQAEGGRFAGTEESVWIILAAVGWGGPSWCGCPAEVRLEQCPQQRKGVPALPGHAEDAMDL